MAERTLLGFDYGLRSIGVAVGQTVTRTASALTLVAARDGTPDWPHIAALVREWRPDALVVGIPLNMDGTASDMSERARRFGRQLQGRFALEVIETDERLSSFEARGHAAEHGDSRRQGGRIDDLAARIILQSHLDGLAG